MYKIDISTEEAFETSKPALLRLLRMAFEEATREFGPEIWAVPWFNTR